MIRKSFVWLSATACLCLAAVSYAQIGMNFFKKPNIADIFKPVVGKGSVYERVSGSRTNTVELSVVGKDSVDGKDAYWMEMINKVGDSSGAGIGKMLVTSPDFEVQRVIFQAPGQPAMEMPAQPGMGAKAKSRMNENLEKWHSVGTESITVPAGTFSCNHWQKDDGKGDVWTSDKISPFGMVKMVQPDETMTLVKVLTDVQDKITGPVQPFDPQQFMKHPKP